MLFDIAALQGVDALPEFRCHAGALVGLRRKNARESGADPHRLGAFLGRRQALRHRWSWRNRCEAPVNRAFRRWLGGYGIFAAGSDTVAFELVPSGMEMHVRAGGERHSALSNA